MRPVRAVSLAAVLACALVVTATVAIPAHADSAPAAPTITDATIAPDEASAIAVAEQYGHPVAVEASTTPTSQVSAQPDGSMQLRSDTLPVRVKQATGWVPVNVALTTAANGMLTPAASAAPVEFSAGGSTLLARVQTAAGDWVTESWPGDALPTPSVSGATATYAEVYPGVDLQLTANAGGMSEVLVVKNATAAANPNLKTLNLTIGGAAVSLDQTQSVQAQALDGSIASSAAPVWWDSSVSGSGPRGPGGDGGLRPLTHSVAGSAVSLDITSATETPAVTYPVYVDPDWSVGVQAYWFTDLAYPNQSYLNGNQAGGIQSVGYGGGYLSRAFWQFGTSPINGKVVLGALFNVTELWSNTCTGKDIQAWRYGNATPGFTWNTDPNMWVHLEGTLNLSAGSSCSGAALEGFNVAPAATWAASSGNGTLQIGLRAANEADSLTRRHFSQSATLLVTYNTIPNTPTALTMTSPARACGTAAAPAQVNNAVQAITLQASTSDADGNNLTTDFYLVYASNLAAYLTRSVGPIAPGPSTASTTYAAGSLAENKYAWRTDSRDTYNTSPYSGYCYFTVDNTPPTAPTVALDPSTPATIPVGSPITVNATATTPDTVGFEYWWGAGSTPPVVTAALGITGAPCNATNPKTAANGAANFSCDLASGIAHLTVSPPDVGTTLWISSIDAAGNVSPAASVAPANIVDSTSISFAIGHAWLTNGLTDTTATSVADTATAPLPLTIGAGLGLAPAQTSTPYSGNDPTGMALNFPAVSTGKGDFTTAPANGAGSFSVGAWVFPASTSGQHTILSQGGTSGSSMELDLVNGMWEFCAPAGTTHVCATTTASAIANQWVFVAGIWDSVNHQLRVVVNGTPGSVHNLSTMQSGSGSFLVGAAMQTATVPFQQWNGQIVNPVDLSGVIDQTQLNLLSNFSSIP